MTSCQHHAPLQGVNCDSNHKAFSGLCPCRKKTYDLHIRRPEFRNPYFVPNYTPTGVPAL